MADKPWAIVAVKNGKFGGVITAECSKRDLNKFTGDFVADGYTVKPVANRLEYLALLKECGINSVGAPP